MNQTCTLGPVRHTGMRICADWYAGRTGTSLLAALVLATGFVLPKPAHAVDGCLVMLCLAAPDWKKVPQCISPIHQLMDDLKKRRPFPTCDSAGAGNATGHQWSTAPDFCPPQYTRLVERGDGTPEYVCDYVGAVSVTIAGEVWTRTWWSVEGPTVTEYSATAKAQLGSWDTRFDDDYATWLASLPPSEPSP